MCITKGHQSFATQYFKTADMSLGSVVIVFRYDSQNKFIIPN